MSVFSLPMVRVRKMYKGLESYCFSDCCRYKHLNGEFQRIARRDKKAFFSDQCKQIEENNKMGKTRDLFKKISSREYFMQRWAK